MNLLRSMAKYELVIYEIDGLSIPVKRYVERRKNVRISIGKESAILRLPKWLTAQEVHKYHIWSRDWIKAKLDQDCASIKHLIPQAIHDHSTIRCMELTYDVRISTTNNKSCRANAKNQVIHISLSEDMNDHDRNSIIKTLLSRVLSKIYYEEIDFRVRQICDTYFGHEINQVRLKYNRSNWGSCSSSGNINLSSRLLLAPSWVRDYVIVHELSHIQHMNHSKAYWSEVSRVYPNYQKAEYWLKKHGADCDFNLIPYSVNKKETVSE